MFNEEISDFIEKKEENKLQIAYDSITGMIVSRESFEATKEFLENQGDAYAILRTYNQGFELEEFPEGDLSMLVNSCVDMSYKN